MIENGGQQLRIRFAFTVFVLLAERLLHKFYLVFCPVIHFPWSWPACVEGEIYEYEGFSNVR